MKYLLAVVVVAGCYQPHPPAGSPCANGACPTGLVCSPATMTCEYTAVDARPDVMADARPDAAIDADTSLFRYRRRITISNGASGELPTGFTIRVPLASLLATLVADGKVKADLSDLRIIGDTLGERDRIVDPPGGPAPVAASFSIAAPIAGASSSVEYALYYGGASVGAAPANGSAVFVVYDDFTAGIASFWLQNDGPITSGGKLVLRAGHTDAVRTDAVADMLPIVSAIELVANVPDPTSAATVQSTGTFWYWFGYQRNDFTATNPWVLWIARGKSEIHAEQKSPVGCENECDGAQVTQDTAAHYYSIERDPTATRFSLDGSVSFTATDMNTEDYSVMARNFMATSDLDIDYIRARARVSPDPVVTVGAEENL